MLKQVAVGFVLGFAGLHAVAGCAAADRCRLDAVRFLPDDPGQLTPYDVTDLVQRLHACKASSDAGR